MDWDCGIMEKTGSVINIVLMLLLPGVLTVSCRQTRYGDAFIVPQAAQINVLHAPWDSLSDGTSFRCFSDGDSFFFLFEVADSTLTYSEAFKGEADVEKEDRVEIFFSPTETMDVYYCAEIDPFGRVLDYSCKFYRDMDYGWNFSTMCLWGHLTEDGYIIAGKISRSELRKLGCDDVNGFWMGVFRADYRKDFTVNWFSAVETNDVSPDFHKPGALFFTKIR